MAKRRTDRRWWSNDGDASRRVHPVVAARRATRRRVEGTAGDDGFSLIELLVVIAILPIVLGGIAMALVSVLSLQNSVSNRVGDSNDALVASTNFNRDIESAQMLTTQSTAACGTASQTQLLGAEWGANSSAPGGYDTVVSYISTSGLNPQTHTTNYTLTRQVCTFGTSPTPTQTTTVAHDIGTPTVTIYGPVTNTSPLVFANLTAQNPNPFANWYTSQNVTSVVFGVNAPNSSYSYSLVGLPGQSKSQGSVSSLTTPAPNPGCSFATTGSGTYANQLCFADFTGYNGTLQSSGHCQTMTRPIAGTPYTLSFCLAVSSNNVGPAVIPTYYNPSGYDSEAYLGNNGFYTGIPGDPALYHTTSNSPYTAAYFTNIQVLDAAGQASSGWTLVTGDAESTDTNEWMEFHLQPHLVDLAEQRGIGPVRQLVLRRQERQQQRLAQVDRRHASHPCRRGDALERSSGFVGRAHHQSEHLRYQRQSRSSVSPTSSSTRRAPSCSRRRSQPDPPPHRPSPWPCRERASRACSSGCCCEAAATGRPEPLEEAKGEGHERGDTLVEVLLALVVLGLAGMALLLGFATSITSSAEHRHLATLDASVRAASDEVIAQVQDATDNAFGPTACSSPYHPTWTLSGSVHVTSYSVWYWNGTAISPAGTHARLRAAAVDDELERRLLHHVGDHRHLRPPGAHRDGRHHSRQARLRAASTQNPGTGTINAPSARRPSWPSRTRRTTSSTATRPLCPCR